MSYDIKVSQLKHLITLQIGESKSNNDGIPQFVFTNILSTKSKINSTSSKEQNVSNGTSQLATKTFIIRYPRIELDEDNSIKYRVLYNNRYYNVKSMYNIENANKYLEIVAEVIL